MFDGWDARPARLSANSSDAAHETQAPDRFRPGRRRGAGHGRDRPHGGGAGRRGRPAQPAHGKPTARSGRTGARQRRLLGLRRLAGGVLRPALGRRPRLLPLRDERQRPHLPQQRLPDHARDRSARRPPGRQPPGRPRAPAGAPPLRLASLERAPDLDRARSPVPRAGLGGEPEHDRGGDGQVDRPQGRRGADVRLAGARAAAACRRRP